VDLRDVAAETLAIIERGAYRAPSGTMVDLREAIDASARGTVLYTPQVSMRWSRSTRGLLAARLAWR